MTMTHSNEVSTDVNLCPTDSNGRGGGGRREGVVTPEKTLLMLVKACRSAGCAVRPCEVTRTLAHKGTMERYNLLLCVLFSLVLN